MIKTCGIYQIRNTTTGKSYVGSSINVENRKKIHTKSLETNNHHSPKLQYSWNNYGPSSFEFIIIEVCSKNILIEREQFWIDALNSYHNGYNSLPLARSSLGFKYSEEQKRALSLSRIGKKRSPLSEEAKKNISESKKGKTHVCYEETKEKIALSHKKSGHRPSSEAIEKAKKAHTGIPLSLEIREKLSEAGRNRVLTEEHKRNISEAHKGLTHSPETCAKLSSIRIGSYVTEETKKKMAISQRLRRAKEKDEVSE